MRLNFVPVLRIFVKQKQRIGSTTGCVNNRKQVQLWVYK